ncbi:MAG: SDR family oxidoreductase [Deltaproteobacteria bacterium]|nr:SDR family oxidoreductase [Deltaproteobacteria bacterium]
MADRTEQNSRVALVTGAASGIGRAIACRLAHDGANIAVADINADGARETAAMIEAIGRRARSYACDMSSKNAVAAMAESVLAGFGRVDILVNNAGTGDSSAGLDDIDESLWDRIYAINVRNPFFLVQRIVRDMIEKATAGCMVNIASTEGKTNRAGSIVYSSSKAALINLTQGLAMQLAPYGIRVNAVCPGLIDTPIWHRSDKAMGMEPGETVQMVVQSAIDSMQLKIARAGTPDEIAAAVAFLCSADASYITGQAINVCGGLEYH